MHTILTNRFSEALDYAIIAHNGQICKTTGVPKITHPYSVAMILALYGFNEDVVIAGLLHDIPEDCEEYSINDIKKKFGNRIAQYVSDVTEPDKSLPWQERKEAHIEHMKRVCFESKCLCAADKYDNLAPINAFLINGDDSIFEKFNAPKEKIIWYYTQMYNSIIYMQRSDDLIFKAYAQEVDTLLKLTGNLIT